MSDDENENENQNEIKAILLGNAGVGKTNLINRAIGLKFDENYNSTSSGIFRTKKIEIGNKSYTVNLWDTAGQEIYKSITKIFVKRSKIVIFVYDITDKKSFDDLEGWIKMCKDLLDNDYICGIAGNKMDLYSIEQVTENEARKFAENQKMKFQLVSAKENPESFDNFLKELIDGNPLFKSETNISNSNNFELKKNNVKPKKKENFVKNIKTYSYINLNLS